MQISCLEGEVGGKFAATIHGRHFRRVVLPMLRLNQWTSRDGRASKSVARRRFLRFCRVAPREFGPSESESVALDISLVEVVSSRLICLAGVAWK